MSADTQIHEDNKDEVGLEYICHDRYSGQKNRYNVLEV